MRITSMLIQTGFSQTTSQGGFNLVRGEFRCALTRIQYLSMEGAVSEIRGSGLSALCMEANMRSMHIEKTGPIRFKPNANSVWTGLKSDKRLDKVNGRQGKRRYIVVQCVCRG